jgi:hypothetical protein
VGLQPSVARRAALLRAGSDGFPLPSLALSQVRGMSAGSTGVRKELGELLRWFQVSEGLARPGAEAAGHPVEVSLTVVGIPGHSRFRRLRVTGIAHGGSLPTLCSDRVTRGTSW